MIKLLYLLVLISFSAWSAVALELSLDKTSVKQGQIVNGRLLVRETNGTAGLSGLKGQNLGKTLYIHSVSPFMAKNGQLESEVRIIFALVPQVTTVKEVINGEEITVSWQAVEVTPTEATKSFLFGDFEVPERRDVLPWIFGLLGLAATVTVIWWVSNRQKQKSLTKSQLAKLKNEIITCSSYDDIVLMWRQKHRYLEQFPLIESEFKSFEEVLFRYQFKAQRSEQEIAEVDSAYQKFKSNVAGVLNGI